MARGASDRSFLTERRAVGLVGAAFLATVGSWFVTRIGYVELLLFFLIFAAVFTGLNYAVYRYE